MQTFEMHVSAWPGVAGRGDPAKPAVDGRSPLETLGGGPGQGRSGRKPRPAPWTRAGLAVPNRGLQSLMFAFRTLSPHPDAVAVEETVGLGGGSRPGPFLAGQKNAMIKMFLFCQHSSSPLDFWPPEPLILSLGLLPGLAGNRLGPRGSDRLKTQLESPAEVSVQDQPGTLPRDARRPGLSSPVRASVGGEASRGAIPGRASVAPCAGGLVWLH